MTNTSNLILKKNDYNTKFSEIEKNKNTDSYHANKYITTYYL